MGDCEESLNGKFPAATLCESTRHSFITEVCESEINTLQTMQLSRDPDVRSIQKYFHGNIVKLRDAVNSRGKMRLL